MPSEVQIGQQWRRKADRKVVRIVAVFSWGGRERVRWQAGRTVETERANFLRKYELVEASGD